MYMIRILGTDSWVGNMKDYQTYVQAALEHVTHIRRSVFMQLHMASYSFLCNLPIKYRHCHHHHRARHGHGHGHGRIHRQCSRCWCRTFASLRALSSARDIRSVIVELAEANAPREGRGGRRMWWRMERGEIDVLVLTNDKNRTRRRTRVWEARRQLKRERSRTHQR